ncbi:hypothetical protein C7999DRAFT_43736 [Corynascus novoguineensis]|uniref:Transposase n=1 Tax=Corynascus novoguineensis TaxID=1126955 RepID=A0AAN7CNR3_9PEZI|nr:hypothetical protein C7999DRAFT_43736 [Corynascus novoguineensis]
MSWAALLRSSPVGVSKNTIRLALGKDFWYKFRSIKQIALNKERAANRLLHVKEMIGQEAVLKEVFRAPKDKYKKDLINVQAQGMIWQGGRSLLVNMNRDPEAKRQGHSANSYIWALEEGLVPYFRPGTFFLQDNAKIHKKMKAILYRDFPGLHLLKRNDVNIAKVAEALKVAWERVPQELIDRLVDSMPKKLAAVRKRRLVY